MRFFIFLFCAIELFSLTLKETYLIDSHNIKLGHLISNAPYNITLYQIEKNRYSKKIKAKELIALLQKHGINSVKSNSRYIHFIKKSPIDMEPIRIHIKKAYQNIYPDIKIKNLLVRPRAYLDSLHSDYIISMPKKYFLSKKGTLNIKTLENKKVFFDYFIDSTLFVYAAKYSLKRGSPISTLNTLKVSIPLDKFRARPITNKYLNTSQLRRNIKTGSILSIKDVETLNLVKKGSNVIVLFQNKNINISFSAKALQSGKLHDIITVVKSNRKRLRVIISGKNQVKIQ